MRGKRWRKEGMARDDGRGRASDCPVIVNAACSEATPDTQTAKGSAQADGTAEVGGRTVVVVVTPIEPAAELPVEPAAELPVEPAAELPAAGALVKGAAAAVAAAAAVGGADAGKARAEEASFSLREAMRTSAFWIFCKTRPPPRS